MNDLKKRYLLSYITTIVVSSILIIETSIFKTTSMVAYILMILGLVNIVLIYQSNKVIITPITIFSLIWLILIPICSFEYPLMRAMTPFEWTIVLIFNICFSIGGVISTFFKDRKIKEKKELSNMIIKLNYIMTIVSIACIFLMFKQYGSIPLFSSDANIAKATFRTTSIFNTLSYFGFIALLMLFINDEKVIKKKLFIILAAIYSILIILSGERFFVSLLILSIVFIYSKKEVNRKFLKKVLIGIALIVMIFLFVLNFRGNSQQKELYFIKSGIYNGTAQELTKTEFFRYLGMQERVLTNTFERVKPGYTMGTLTFSPLLKVLRISPVEIPDVQIYGYTSKTIITKVYADFGHFWWLAIIALSIIINKAYFNFKRTNNYLSQYYYVVWMIFLTFSFYAYFDNFIILFLHFPIYIMIITIMNNQKRRCIT